MVKSRYVVMGSKVWMSCVQCVGVTTVRGNIWGGILLRFVRPPRSGIITSIFMADADTEWRCCYTSSRSHEQCAASAVCRKHLLAASSQTMESKVTLT